MLLLSVPVFLVLAVLALYRVRWAYVAFVSLGLLFFPARVGFRMHPQPCALFVDIPLAIHSLTNYAHIALFAVFFVLTFAQFRRATGSRWAWAAAATVVMGVLVELAEGVSGRGHCRLRDLIPDSVAILPGAAIAWAWDGVRKKRKEEE